MKPLRIIQKAVTATVGLLLGWVTPVFGVVDCQGTVQSLSMALSTSGTVTLSLSGGPSFTYLCDTAGSGRNAVDPGVCKTMYATLLLTKAMNKQVVLRFYDYPTCAAVPSWANAGTL